MERKALCIILDALRPDGDARYVLDILRFADRSRFRFHVLSLATPDGDTAIEVQKLAVPVHSLDLPEESTWADARWSFTGTLTLFNLLREMGPELVHTVGERADLCGRWAARLARVPRVVTTWRRPRSAGGLRRLASLPTAHLADVVIAPTKALGCDAVDGGPVHPCRLRVIPPGVDAARVGGGVPPPDLAGDGPLVGTLARMDDAKGIDTLVDAAAILFRYHPTLRVVVVGTGTAGIGYLRRAQRLDMADRFFFPGARDDVAGVLAALDVFVMPSRRDGIPLALLEALSVGLPCVATRLPSIEETLVDEENLLLCAPGHPALLADRVDRLLLDRTRADALGSAGRDLVRERFLASRCAAAHEELWSSLINS